MASKSASRKETGQSAQPTPEMGTELALAALYLSNRHKN